MPGVVYGHGTEPVAVAVGGRELRLALSGEAGSNTLLSLQTGKKSFLTVARELQRNPLSGMVTHVDFQIVRRDEVIGAEVPVVLVGDAIEVHHAEGVVDQQLFALPVRAKPADIPTSVEVDVSALVVGAVIRVGDLDLPSGVTADLEAEVPVVTGIPPRVVAGEEVPGEAAGEGAAEPSGGTGEGAAATGEAAAESEG